jgi:hypothetical protein
MKLNDKEHYEKMGIMYESGVTNELFKAYRWGYSFGLTVGREDTL